MKVYFVGGGPGDINLLTVAAHNLITECNCCVYAGSLLSDEVLALIPKDAKKYDSAEMTLEQKVEVFKEAKEKGIDVIRLHSGDPSIYGAIREQMNELDKLDIKYEVIPGISSYQAAAAVLDLELTVPNTVQTVILTRSAGRTPVPKEQGLDKLGKTGATLCIFLSVQRIAENAKTLAREYGTDCPVAVVYRVSWPDQKIIRGTLADIAEKVIADGITKTAMIIVGHALSRNHAASKLYDKNFSHGYRKKEE